MSRRKAGASLATLSRLLGLNNSTVSRRHDNAVRKIAADNEFGSMVATAVKKYQENAK
ncbi:MAG: hypothetical protein WKF34_06795 [Pyrinomonadaceae bacterium]